MMMVAERRVDGIVTGLNFAYSDTVRPALQIIGLRPHVRRIAGMYLMLHKSGMLFSVTPPSTSTSMSPPSPTSQR